MSVSMMFVYTRKVCRLLARKPTLFERNSFISRLLNSNDQQGTKTIFKYLLINKYSNKYSIENFFKGDNNNVYYSL